MLPHIGIDTAEQQKILLEYDNALKGDGDFTKKLHQLWEFQVKLVEKYGKDGLALLLDFETRVYVDADTKRSLQIHHYAEAPENCPWHHLRELPVKDAIRKAWEAFPIAFVETLEMHCKDLFVIFEEERWYLAYAYLKTEYDGAVYYDFLGGRQPEPGAQLPEALLKAGWEMPEDLQRLYAVHGSFGSLAPVLRGHSECIIGAEKLELSMTYLEEYVEAWEVDYSFFDLLPFCDDGVGNSQVFYKPSFEDDSYATVDWDHETKELSGWQSLADFIDHQFTEELEGED